MNIVLTLLLGFCLILASNEDFESETSTLRDYQMEEHIK